MSAEHLARTRTTTLLHTAVAGDAGAAESLDALVPLLYDELRALAHRQLSRERGDITLQTTELVHEAFLRLVDVTQVTGRGRAYFFAAAAQSMRRVLVDHARRRSANKRGNAAVVSDWLRLDAAGIAVDTFSAELLDLDTALGRLASIEPRQARVVECRYFGGLSVEETADALGVSERTVKSEWAVARAWLYHHLGQPAAG
ncbi:MAG: ECF-type sigma factor [Gemmatimonadaceae bacterium]